MSSILERHLDLETLHEKPVVQKLKLTPKPAKPIDEIAQQWITTFNEAIGSKDAAAVAALFQEDGTTIMVEITDFRMVERRPWDVVGLSYISIGRFNQRNDSTK